MLFDLITAARLGAGGCATDQLMDELPNLGQPAPQE